MPSSSPALRPEGCSNSGELTVPCVDSERYLRESRSENEGLVDLTRPSSNRALALVEHTRSAFKLAVFTCAALRVDPRPPIGLCFLAPRLDCKRQTIRRR